MADNNDYSFDDFKAKLEGFLANPQQEIAENYEIVSSRVGKNPILPFKKVLNRIDANGIPSANVNTFLSVCPLCHRRFPVELLCFQRKIWFRNYWICEPCNSKPSLPLAILKLLVTIPVFLIKMFLSFIVEKK